MYSSGACSGDPLNEADFPGTYSGAVDQYPGVKSDASTVVVLGTDGSMTMKDMPTGFFGASLGRDSPTRLVDASGTWTWGLPRPGYSENVLTLHAQTVDGQPAQRNISLDSRRSSDGVEIWFHPYDPDNPRFTLRRR